MTRATILHIQLLKGHFYSAFIIRKLIDCGGKLSDEADNYSIQVKAIKPLKHIDNLNRWPEEDSHDWEHEKQLTVAGKDICNWLIHSYLFFSEFEENGPMLAFCVSSDYDRNKILYKISMCDWLRYIDYIASDDIVGLSSHYDEKQAITSIHEKNVGQDRHISKEASLWQILSPRI